MRYSHPANTLFRGRFFGDFLPSLENHLIMSDQDFPD